MIIATITYFQRYKYTCRLAWACAEAIVEGRPTSKRGICGALDDLASRPSLWGESCPASAFRRSCRSSSRVMLPCTCRLVKPRCPTSSPVIWRALDWQELSSISPRGVRDSHSVCQHILSLSAYEDIFFFFFPFSLSSPHPFFFSWCIHH